MRRKIIYCDRERKRGIDREMEDEKSMVRMGSRCAGPEIYRPLGICKCQERRWYADDCSHDYGSLRIYWPPKCFSSSSISRSAIASIALSSTSGSSSVGGGRVLSAMLCQYCATEMLKQTNQAPSSGSSSHLADRCGMNNEVQ